MGKGLRPALCGYKKARGVKHGKPWKPPTKNHYLPNYPSNYLAELHSLSNVHIYHPDDQQHGYHSSASTDHPASQPVTH